MFTIYPVRITAFFWLVSAHKALELLQQLNIYASLQIFCKDKFQGYIFFNMPGSLLTLDIFWCTLSSAPPPPSYIKLNPFWKNLLKPHFLSELRMRRWKHPCQPPFSWMSACGQRLSKLQVMAIQRPIWLHESQLLFLYRKQPQRRETICKRMKNKKCLRVPQQAKC